MKTTLPAIAALTLGVFALPALAAPPASAPAAPAASAPATQPAADPVIAKVNGQDVHRSELLKQMPGMGPQEQAMLQLHYPEILEKLITVKLVSAKGYAEKMQNEPEVKEGLKNAEAQMVAQAYVRKAIQPKISETKIKERYDELSSKFKPQDEVRARHILVQTEEEANDVIKQLQGGADFAKLAAEKSKDSGSAKNGGDLNYFPRETMVKAFSDAAFSMKPGEVSDKPVKTEFGYHVIKVEDKRKSAPPPLAEVHDQIAQQLGQEMTDELVKSLKSSAKIERYDLNGNPLKTSEAKSK